MAVADRLQLLLQQNTVTGIDFVDVDESQTQLDVYFFQHDNDPQADMILGEVDPKTISIYTPYGADTLPEVNAETAVWKEIDERTVLELLTAYPGDFSQYRLRFSDNRVDHFFNDVSFSFKANCESDLDCKPDDPDCYRAEKVDFPVNYLARDFSSFKNALMEFASLRYPDWKDRLEADVGIMLAEVMSAMGDEFAYSQDNISRQAYLETCTQRVSLKRHARLVDYWVHDGLGASGTIVVMASDGQADTVDAGTQVQALSDTGEPIIYEIGRGLEEALSSVSYPVNFEINALEAHILDEDDLCLAKGATELLIKGKHKENLAFDDPLDNPSGKWVVIAMTESNLSPCPLRFLVRITDVLETRDEILSEDITRLHWDQRHSIPQELELENLYVYGNVLPITAGATVEKKFVVGVEVKDLSLPSLEASLISRAVERQGNNYNVQYLFTLLDEDEKELVFLSAESEPAEAIPEIQLQEVEFDGVNWQPLSRAWSWRRTFLGVNSSQPIDQHYTLEDGSWQRVVGYWRGGEEIIHQDYADNIGKTICFGNDEFGRVPAEGTVFSVVYRLGNGLDASVAPDSITELVNESLLIESVFNPFALSNGMDAESDEDVRRFAPQAFRSLTYRAVRPEDYAESVERLSWVQRAGASERWTGSWLTTFVTPDPIGSTSVSDLKWHEFNQQLNRFRQAGRDVNSTEPAFADLDFRITICVKQTVYKGDVKQTVLDVLIGSGSGDSDAFFSADHFTFGKPLARSRLEATIQNCYGVKAVLNIEFRRRGWFDWRNFDELYYAVGMDQVIRVENDPVHPSRGSVNLIMEGGA